MPAGTDGIEPACLLLANAATADGIMVQRSRAREVALQLLYQRDLNPAVPRDAVEDFVRRRLRDTELESFCLSLYDGAIDRAAAVDQNITEAAQNWRLARMTAVDRNVLRLGSYELLFAPQTPPGVVINEAIELARRYGSANSPAFVNGVLDRILKMTNDSRTNDPMTKE
jgi:N utilization substance protein B